MSDFVSGGQITMHNFRMLGQVMKKLYLGVVIGFIFVGVYSFYQNTTFYERNKLFSLLKAEIIQNFYGEGNPSLEKVTIKFMKIVPSNSKSKYKYEIVERSMPYFMRFCPEQCRMRLENKVYDSLKMGGIGSLVVVALMMMFFKRRGIAARLSKFIRGGQIASEKDLIRHIKKLNRKYKEKTHKLAGIPYPYRSQEQNTLVIGSTGTGKTQLISDLVEQIRKKGERLIVYDKKGDYLSWFYKKEKDFILNPFDKRGEKWNLLNEVEHVGMLKTLAESFIPNRGERSGENKIWEESARFVFGELAKKILNKEGVCSNKALVDKILKKDLTELAAYLKDTDAQSIINTDAKKIAASVVFMLTTHLNTLSLTKGEKEDSFSIRKWMEGEDSDSALFITNKAEFEGELAPLESAWFEIVINSILSGEQNNKKKTWIIIDELATLNKIPSLQKGLAAARSYGGCFVLGIQNISQLRDIYGMNSTGIISSECNTRCIFKTNDPETSKWVSDNLGQEEIIENKKSLSYGASEVRDGVNLSSNNKLRTLALPSEIQNMDRMNLYIKMVDSPVIKKGIKYVERKIVEPDLFILDKQVVDKVGDIKTDVKTKDADDNLPKGNLDLNQGKDEESENIEQNIENKDSKKYDHENFENLLDGKIIEKEEQEKAEIKGKELTLKPEKGIIQLGRRTKEGIIHDPGQELILSAPKSFSIMHLVAKDKRLEEVHHNAIKAVARYIEKNMLYTRIQKEGKLELVRADNLACAYFTHLTARPAKGEDEVKLGKAPDPQLHSHLIFCNATKCEDGKWRSIVFDKLYDYQLHLGEIYRMELERGSREVGYKTILKRDEKSGKWTFEIDGGETYKGLEEDMLEFSTRRKDIEELADRENRHDSQSMAFFAKVTRDEKIEYSRDELQYNWEARVKSLEVLKSLVKEAEMNNELRKDIIITDDMDIDRTNIKTKEGALEEGIDYAVRLLSEKESVWEYESLVSAAIEKLSSQYGVDEIEQVISRRIEKGNFITSPKYSFAVLSTNPLSPTKLL